MCHVVLKPNGVIKPHADLREGSWAWLWIFSSWLYSINDVLFVILVTHCCQILCSEIKKLTLHECIVCECIPSFYFSQREFGEKVAKQQNILDVNGTANHFSVGYELLLLFSRLPRWVFPLTAESIYNEHRKKSRNVARTFHLLFRNDTTIFVREWLVETEES